MTHRFTVPFPPSTNRMWRTFRGRTVLSQEGRDYKAAVARQLEGMVPLEGPVALALVCWFPSRRGDLTNRLKVLEDALQGLAYVNDSQVERLSMVRALDRAAPRVEVEVEPIGQEVMSPTEVGRGRRGRAGAV